MLLSRVLIFFKINFFEKFFLQYNQSVNQQDPGQARRFVGPDLGPNYCDVGVVRPPPCLRHNRVQIVKLAKVISGPSSSMATYLVFGSRFSCEVSSVDNLCKQFGLSDGIPEIIF